MREPSRAETAIIRANIAMLFNNDRRLLRVRRVEDRTVETMVLHFNPDFVIGLVGNIAVENRYARLIAAICEIIPEGYYGDDAVAVETDGDPEYTFEKLKRPFWSK